MILELILLFLGTILAFWISAICGGGASLILIPLLNLILPVQNVPFALTLGTFSSSVSRIAIFKKHIHWKIFFWFVPFSIPAVLFGAYLIKYLNPNYLQIFVAFFLISNVSQLFRSRSSNEIHKPFQKNHLAIIGFLAGFISGITGAIGLLFNRFYLKYGLEKEQIVATRAANEVFLHLIKIITYISLGLFSKTSFTIGIVIALGSIISSYSVKYILPYLSDHLFKKIGFVAMVISGFVLFWTSSNKIIKQDNLYFQTSKDSQKNISVLNWRESKITFEYAFNYGFEIEHEIQPHQLPMNLLEKYNHLAENYENIYIEKVYKLGRKASFEFHCFRDNRMTKMKV